MNADRARLVALRDEKQDMEMDYDDQVRSCVCVCARARVPACVCTPGTAVLRGSS